MLYETVLISDKWKETPFDVCTLASIYELFHCFVMDPAEIRWHELVYLGDFLEILAQKSKEIRSFFIFSADYFPNTLS